VGREELRHLYRTCLFFVQPGEEDFGIAAAEAVACGAPVAALSRGGVLDIVRDGAEGVLYGEESAAGLAGALSRGERLRFGPEEMRRSAERFSTPRFRARFRRAVEELTTSQSLRR
jgi:glycosyltransferase involved in cell wall biosynthesis